jgi:G2/mitotic-specific cyclin 2
MIDYLSRKEILHDAFFKKYAAKKYMKASIIVREWIRSEYAEEEITSAMMETKEEVEEAGQENMPEEDENVSDEDDYMYANELEEHEVE